MEILVAVATAVGVDGRQERAQWNAALFFEAREGLRTASGTKDDQSPDALNIFCECGRDECFGKVTVPFRVFLRARKHAGWFIVLAGHHAHGMEEVVEAADSYWVVGKQHVTRTSRPGPRVA
jgi:hypothetical protein